MKPGVAPSLLSTLSLLLLSACGQDSQIQTGVFIDSPVSNLAYVTQTGASFTNERGEFQYKTGESITFKVGDIAFPKVPAKSVITPLDLVGTTNIKNRSISNIARLLQTLDTDGDPENGITISNTAHDAATGWSLDFDSETFEADVVNLVANADSIQTSLVTEQAALRHLADTLNLPTYYGLANYSCLWKSSLVTETPAEEVGNSSENPEGEDSEDGPATEGDCELALSTGDVGNMVKVTYDDGAPNAFDGVIEGTLLSFSGKIAEPSYVITASLVFSDETFSNFTGTVSGSGEDASGTYVPFTDTIEEGVRTSGFFNKVLEDG